MEETGPVIYERYPTASSPNALVPVLGMRICWGRSVYLTDPAWHFCPQSEAPKLPSPNTSSSDEVLQFLCALGPLAQLPPVVEVTSKTASQRRSVMIS